MSGERQWLGETDDVIIASDSDPWLQDEHGRDIDLSIRYLREPMVYGPCGEQIHTLIPGVLGGINTDYGVERCDACAVFEGDLQAARALAEAIGEGVTVWYMDGFDEEDDEE